MKRFKFVSLLSIVSVFILLLAGCAPTPAETEEPGIEPMPDAPTPLGLAPTLVPTPTSTPILTPTLTPSPTLTPTSTPTSTPTPVCDKEQIQDTLSKYCGSMGNNEVCYGINVVDADFSQPMVEFETPGDIADVFDLETLQTSAGGVAKIIIQEEQLCVEGKGEVYIYIYGNVEFKRNCRVHMEENVCKNLPSGMVFTTEAGVCKYITINGVEIELGSAALLTLQDDNTRMTILNIGKPTDRDGSKVRVTANGVTVNVPTGWQTSVELRDDQPIGTPAAPSLKPENLLFISPIPTSTPTP